MKSIVIQLDDKFHKEIKMEAIRWDKSIKKYVTELIQKDLETKKEQTQ